MNEVVIKCKKGRVQRAKALNIGCSIKVMSDALNVDIVDGPGIDIVGDIRDILKQGVFRKNQLKKVIAWHVFEHIPDWEQIMRDLWPYCAHRCVIDIRAPYYNCPGYYNSMDHCRFFNWKPFRSFVHDEFIRDGVSKWEHGQTELMPSKVGSLIPNINTRMGNPEDKITLRTMASWYIGNIIREVRGTIIVVKK